MLSKPLSLIQSQVGIALGAFLLVFLGCAPSIKIGTSYIGVSTPPSLASYSAQAFVIQPQFSIYNFYSNSVSSNTSGTFSFGLFLDSICQVSTSVALGSSLSGGTTKLSGISYLLPTSLEQQVYLGGSYGGLTYCGNPVSILHYFQPNYGYTTFQNNGLGAAGASNATKNDSAYATQADSQGRYVVVGQSKNSVGGYEMTIWRYNPDGSPDLTLSSTGAITFQHNGFGAAGAANGAAKYDMPAVIQIDGQGRYVIAGTSENSAGGSEMAIWRYNPDGSPDIDFGSTGAVTFQNNGLGAAGDSNASKNDVAYGLQIDGQNRYVLAGSSYNSLGKMETAVWRYNSDGTPDLTFSSSGAVTFQNNGAGAAGAANNAKRDQANVMQIDSQGRYLLAGFSNNIAGSTEMALWRYNSNGSPDTTFSSTGALTFQPNGFGAAGSSNLGKNDFAIAFQIDSQGRYVVAGQSANSVGRMEMVIWRLDSNGNFDTSFTSTGAVTFQNNGLGTAGASNAAKSDQGYALQIDSQGRYVVAGQSLNSVNKEEMAIWRYNPDGTPDKTFSPTGGLTFRNNGLGAAGASNAAKKDELQVAGGLIIDAQGRYVIVGFSLNSSSKSEMAIWRYLPSGNLDK